MHWFNHVIKAVWTFLFLHLQSFLVFLFSGISVWLWQLLGCLLDEGYPWRLIDFHPPHHAWFWINSWVILWDALILLVFTYLHQQSMNIQLGSIHSLLMWWHRALLMKSEAKPVLVQLRGSWTSCHCDKFLYKIPLLRYQESKVSSIFKCYKTAN